MDDERLRERLIGATVILALAVVFLPMVLRGPERAAPSGAVEDAPPRIIQLGEPTHAPAVDSERWVVVPEHPSTTRGARGAQPTSTESADAPEPQGTPQDTAVADGKPRERDEARAAPPAKEGYAVQVGSFSVERNALALREKLRKQGHSAFVESLSTAKGRVYRVRVGPHATRAEADALRQELHTQMGMQGLVLRHP